MSLIDIVFLAVALAMDCLAVSIVSGVLMGRREWRPVLSKGALFGLFQGLMPLLGWLGTSYFSHYLQPVDHWIAFGLLALIGGNMIRESRSDEPDRHFNPRRLATQLLLAVATSIDALAVGVSLACTGYQHMAQLLLPLVIIGLVSLLFSLLGNELGIRFGRSIARRLQPELLGGIILIGIGLKILLTHLLGAE